MTTCTSIGDVEAGALWDTELVAQDDSDTIRPGRITMKPTSEQTALMKARGPQRKMMSCQRLSMPTEREDVV